jgi:hypothetical protein
MYMSTLQLRALYLNAIMIAIHKPGSPKKNEKFPPNFLQLSSAFGDDDNSTAMGPHTISNSSSLHCISSSNIPSRPPPLILSTPFSRPSFIHPQRQR